MKAVTGNGKQSNGRHIERAEFVWLVAICSGEAVLCRYESEPELLPYACEKTLNIYDMYATATLQ